MEKNGKAKESRTYKERSIFVIKGLLLVLCLVVVVQFAVVAKAFASLKAVTKRLDALEKEKILGSKSLITEKSEHGGRRAKRSTNETDIKKALMKLKKLEGR